MISSRFIAMLLLAVCALATKAGVRGSEPVVVEHYSITEYKKYFGYADTVGEPDSIKCDICKFALGKAYSIGCSAGATWIAGACLDFAPVCEAALKLLCDECKDHCDVSNLIDKACTDVHLC